MDTGALRKLLVTGPAIAIGLLITVNPSVGRQLLLVLLGAICGAILAMPLNGNRKTGKIKS